MASETRSTEAAVPVSEVAGSSALQVDSVELQLRIWFAPMCFGLSLFLHGMCGGRFLQRLFFTMPLHELGHAVTAWFCGFSAMPLFWQTRIVDHRSFGLPLLMAAGIATMFVRGVRAREWGWVAFASCLGFAQFVGTLVLSAASARALVTFGGDAGAMVFATALVSTFCFGEDTPLKQGQLRFGFVAIGSVAYVDVFSSWWAARRDWGVIPFGEMEGVGLTDPTKLTDTYGWSIDAMVDRYVTLGVACACVFVAVWIWGVIVKDRVHPRSHREALMTRSANGLSTFVCDRGCSRLVRLRYPRAFWRATDSASLWRGREHDHACGRRRSSEINLAARQAGQAQNVCTLTDPVELVAVFPHMHRLGKKIQVEVGRSTDSMKMLYARDPYDFDDQHMEKTHISLQADDVLRVTCDYMNTGDKTVTFGESTNDEMCFFVGFALGDSPGFADCPNLWDALFTLQ